jgi:hypothetical protein
MWTLFFPKPKLPRRPKKRAKFFTLADVARIIVASEGEDRLFYWLVAETGLRSGELAGLRLTDIDGERLTVNRSVWLGKEQAPKTNNSIRSLALSPQLISLLWEQIARQRAKGHDFFVLLQQRKTQGHERVPPSEDDDVAQVSGDTAGGIPCLPSFQRGIARRPSRSTEDDPRADRTCALTGSFTLDVYGGQPEWGRNLRPHS